MITIPKKQFKIICEKLNALGFRSLKEYYNSEYWRNTKERMKNSRWGYKCKCCWAKDKPLSLHHKTYETLGKENLRHVIWLCSDCHLKSHERIDHLHKINSPNKDRLYRAHNKLRNKFKKIRKKERREASERRKNSTIIQKEDRQKEGIHQTTARAKDFRKGSRNPTVEKLGSERKFIRISKENSQRCYKKIKQPDQGTEGSVE